MAPAPTAPSSPLWRPSQKSAPRRPDCGAGAGRRRSGRRRTVCWYPDSRSLCGPRSSTGSGEHDPNALPHLDPEAAAAGWCAWSWRRLRPAYGRRGCCQRKHAPKVAGDHDPAALHAVDVDAGHKAWPREGEKLESAEQADLEGAGVKQEDGGGRQRQKRDLAAHPADRLAGPEQNEVKVSPEPSAQQPVDQRRPASSTPTEQFISWGRRPPPRLGVPHRRAKSRSGPPDSYKCGLPRPQEPRHSYKRGVLGAARNCAVVQMRRSDRGQGPLRHLHRLSTDIPHQAPGRRWCQASPDTNSELRPGRYRRGSSSNTRGRGA